jgi:prepilin-type N-terminal cleavage/methylation domain-containing protein
MSDSDRRRLGASVHPGTLRRWPAKSLLRVSGAYHAAAKRGFTLAEIVVVLVVLGLGAALVAPALVPPGQDDVVSISAVIGLAQNVAAGRGETVVLSVSPDGGWEIHGASSASAGALSAGHLPDSLSGSGFTLRVAPFGSCGTTLASDATEPGLNLDPLTCRIDSQ